ncbi:MAG: aspartate kinase [Mogibacterium sp.]|nr:aspartate kinase [Mogibacterium sp.]
MRKKVLKFGGSSVANASQLAKLKNIVMADPGNRYVVVSAPGKRFSSDSKVTDLLYLCKSQIDNNIPYEELFRMICSRYEDSVQALELDIDMTPYYEEIAAVLAAGSKAAAEGGADAANRVGCTADYVASRGEYLSAILTAAYLGYDFVDTAGLVLFDAKGRLLTEETYAALAGELARHEKAVIPGFYGTIQGTDRIKVFSRGGSDVTGSVVARAINADIYENWTDVSGMLMADPRIVPNPKPIDRISYLELRELSYMGATVLHEDAVFPAREADIPINIRNTNVPADPGTVIDNNYNGEDGKVISGIAGSRDFTVIAVHKNMMNKELGFVRKALQILEDYEVNFDHIPTGIDTLSVVIETKEIEGKLDDIVWEFRKQLKADEIKVIMNISLIAVVGKGMSGRIGTSARILTALAKAGINVRMINQGSSEINVIIAVETPDFENAVRVIYNEFA